MTDGTGDGVRILGRERVADGFVKLDRVRVEIAAAPGQEIVRDVHDHGHGAAVLPVDEARRTVLLVRQPRLPVHMVEGDGRLVEAAAGLIDPEDRDPAHAARREAEEELGYRVHDLREVVRLYTCPGVVTETITCFLARYGERDRLSDGGGADPDEAIEVLEWSLDELEAARRGGRIRDAKTLVLVQALRLERPDLFIPTRGGPGA